ncbi:MAG: FG-GAP-like repeat-containing protein [Acidobacteriota bacterium]
MIEGILTIFLVVMAVADVNQYPYFGVAAIWYGPQVSYPTGQGPFSVTAVDLDGDKILDLVAPNRDSANLTVYRGIGNGAFTPLPVPLAGGNCPIFVVDADFNRDGIPDLAVINHLCNRLFVLLGVGGGDFAPPAIYETALEPRSIVAADLNNDTFPDLAVANRMSGTISIFGGQGDGTFLPRVDFNASLNPHAIVAADFNGDLLLDLAVANTGTNSVTIFQNNGVSGGGASYVSLPDIPAGLGCTALTTTDLNRDGRPDLVVVDVSLNGVSVLLANGNFSFASLRFYATGGSPFAIRSGDLNADGNPDVVVANRNSNNVAALLGDGDGTFANTTHLNSFATGQSPYDVAIGDFNRDGRIDLVTSNFVDNTISVLLAEPPQFADLALTLQASAGTVAARGQVTYTVQVSNLGPDASTNLVVRNTLPTRMALVSCATSIGAPCVVQGGEASLAIPTLTAGGVASMVIVAAAGDNICTDDQLIDTAIVTARTGDPYLENNQAANLVTGTNTPPVITPMTDILAINYHPGSMEGVVVNFTNPTATDNVPGVSVVCRQNSGTVFPVGSTPVTCTATDICGLTSSTTFFVRVWDVILIDDRSRHLFLFDSFTGNYLFRRGDTGEEHYGRGMVTRRGCEIRLVDDKRAEMVFNRCLLTGSGVYRPNGVAPVFLITDRYTPNNRL